MTNSDWPKKKEKTSVHLYHKEMVRDRIDYAITNIIFLCAFPGAMFSNDLNHLDSDDRIFETIFFL